VPAAFITVGDVSSPRMMALSAMTEVMKFLKRVDSTIRRRKFMVPPDQVGKGRFDVPDITDGQTAPENNNRAQHH